LLAKCSGVRREIWWEIEAVLLPWPGRRKSALPLWRNARKVPMLDATASHTSAAPEGREARLQALRARLHAAAEAIADRMAECLVDLPDERAFGQIEYDLRDLAHALAASAHQAGLEVGKKRGM
jgi:hypothetical protein